MNLPCVNCHRGVRHAAPEDVWWRGVRLGRFVVETCSNCGKRYVDDKNAGALDKAFDRARSKGLLPPPEFDAHAAILKEQRKAASKRAQRAKKSGPRKHAPATRARPRPKRYSS